MITVHVIGWKEKRGVLPLSFLEAVRKHCGLGLVQAKALLDEFAHSGEVRVRLEDAVRAQALVSELSALGARCEVIDEPGALKR